MTKMRTLWLFFLCFSMALQATDEHTFYFFYKDRGGRTAVAEKKFDQVMEQLGEQATAFKVQVADATQQEILEKYQVKKSALPYIVVVAPNGAVTGRFSMSITEKQLLSALSCPGQQACLGALQKGKTVILCMHKGDSNAMRGVRRFASDRRFAKQTVVIALNADDHRECFFLQKLGVDLDTHKPHTVLLAPSGEVLGIYDGLTSKHQLITDLSH